MDDKENLESDLKYLNAASIIRDQNTFYCISEYILSILESNPYAINRFTESIRASKCSISNTKYEQRIKDVIAELEKRSKQAEIIGDNGKIILAYQEAISLLKNGVKQ